jgi:hypothetical protein
VLLLGTLRLGNTTIPGCPGLTVPLRSPQVLAAPTADAWGTATVSLRVPTRLAGLTPAFIAVEIATCRASLPGTQTF